MQKKWKFHPHDSPAAAGLASASGVSPVVARLLSLRGIDSPARIRQFLDAKLVDLRAPAELPGVPAATERIQRSITSGEEIVVHGDYDCDGMTSTAILYLCLKQLGAAVSYHLPNRLDDGYGLHADIVEKLAERGKKLIVTVDCGIGSCEAARRARQLGVGLVITDHHQFGSELPDADAIVHPALPGCDYPFHGLCGAGVAFKLAWALCQNAQPKPGLGAQRVADHLRDFLIRALSLAAIGTVADVVPLVDENRIIVRNGLRSLSSTAMAGLSRLLMATKLNERKVLSSEDIAFTLAPRLNAAGRLGQAQLGVELLTTADEKRAEALADYIQQLNANRETLERSMLLSAIKQANEEHSTRDDPALVLAMPGWHPGVIGIVAGKLAEKYHKPVVMIALDQIGAKPGIGSARSPSGVDLHLALQSCAQWLISGGGHAAAAGLKIEEKQVIAFRAAFCEAVAEQTGRCENEPQIIIDAEAPLGLLDLAAVEQIELLAPFGHGNHRPLLCASGVQMLEPPKTMGGTGRHLSLQLTQHGSKLRAVAFGQAENWLESLSKVHGLIDVAYRPVINDFRGFKKVELHIVDWRPHTLVPPTPHLGGTRIARESV